MEEEEMAALLQGDPWISGYALTEGLDSQETSASSFQRLECIQGLLTPCIFFSLPLFFFFWLLCEVHSFIDSDTFWINSFNLILQLRSCPYASHIFAYFSLLINGANGASQVAQWYRIHLPRQETHKIWVLFLGWEDHLEKEMATHSSDLTWIIS